MMQKQRRTRNDWLVVAQWLLICLSIVIVFFFAECQDRRTPDDPQADPPAGQGAGRIGAVPHTDFAVRIIFLPVSVVQLRSPRLAPRASLSVSRGTFSPSGRRNPISALTGRQMARAKRYTEIDSPNPKSSFSDPVTYCYI